MKKFKLFTLAVLIAVFGFAIPAHAVLQDMQASVYRWTGGMSSDGNAVLERITTGITFQVLSHGSDTEETLYYFGSKAMTSLTNPVTTTSFEATAICNDRVAFRVDPTDSTDDRYVDLIVTDTAGGFSLFYPHFDKYTHTLVIDERPNVVHQGTIWFNHTTTSEKSTGIAFGYDTMIMDVRVEVVGTCSGCTIDVGLLSSETSGDADGLRDNVLLTTAGFIKDTGVITQGTSIDYTAVSTYGALLYTALTGTDTQTSTTQDAGGRSYIGHVVTGANAKTLVFSVNSTTSGDGYIHYWFNKIR